jgi:hypothetical protein
LLINPLVHIKRRIFIAKTLKDFFGILVYKQFGVCTFCKSSLFFSTNLNIFKELTNYFFFFNAELNCDANGILKLVSFLDFNKSTVFFNLINESSRYFFLKVSFFIPKIVGRGFPFSFLFQSKFNKELIHGRCKTIKKIKNYNFYVYFHMLFKNINSKKIMEKKNNIIYVYLRAKNQMNNLHKLKNKIIKIVFKILNLMIKGLVLF